MYNDSANSKGRLYLYKTCKKSKIRFNQSILYDKKYDSKSYEVLFYDYVKNKLLLNENSFTTIILNSGNILITIHITKKFSFSLP